MFLFLKNLNLEYLKKGGESLQVTFMFLHYFAFNKGMEENEKIKIVLGVEEKLEMSRCKI